MNGTVTSVSRRPDHFVSKEPHASIRLLEGVGVEDDVHGSLLADAPRPNLRQVHLMHSELHEELNERGFEVRAAEMGENVTTRGVDLLALPTGTKLALGDEAVVELTGLRDPCSQLEGIQKGLMKAVLDRDEDGNLVRKSGVMAIVLAGGEIRPGDPIAVELPPEPHLPLEPV